jgi:ubiquinone/menaquinone biosynthesis C-methylase UbiE
MEYVNCNLCGSDNFESVLKVPDQLSNSIDRFILVKCTNCGLVSVNPRPKKSEMAKYYTLEYYEPMHDSIKKEKNFIIRFYDHFKDKISRKKLYEKVQRVEKNTEYPGMIVDVGCGNGDFLGKMKSRGWKCQGIEISDVMSEYATQKYGINVFNGEFEDAKLSEDSVDALTFWHSLEHLHDPMGALRESYRVLKHDGLIIITVPNIESYEFMLLKEKWPHLDVPRHLYQWSASTLTQALKKTKFRKIRLFHFTNLSMSHLKLLVWPEHLEKLRLGNEKKNKKYVLFSKIMFELLHYLSLPLSLVASLLEHGHSVGVAARK